MINSMEYIEKLMMGIMSYIWVVQIVLVAKMSYLVNVNIIKMSKQIISQSVLLVFSSKYLTVSIYMNSKFTLKKCKQTAISFWFWFVIY